MPELQRHGTGQGQPRGERALPGRRPGPAGTSASTRISAGPIKTLSAAGIGGFRKMLAHVAEVAPLRRNVSIEDVGNAAAFLCSTWPPASPARSCYVDNGFSTVGMSFADEAGSD